MMMKIVISIITLATKAIIMPITIIKVYVYKLSTYFHFFCVQCYNLYSKVRKYK